MKGNLQVVCGPMFCGKSEELARRIRRLKIANKNVVVFKHSADSRYDQNNVVSHIGTQIEAHPLRSDTAFGLINTDNVDVIAIDEIQFFDSEILDFINIWLEEGTNVIVAGLDQTYRGEGFGIMPELMAQADYLVKLTAVCQKCGGRATMTQRLINNKPAPFEGETVVIGAQEQYEARCRNCHESG